MKRWYILLSGKGRGNCHIPADFALGRSDSMAAQGIRFNQRVEACMRKAMWCTHGKWDKWDAIHPIGSHKFPFCPILAFFRSWICPEIAKFFKTVPFRPIFSFRPACGWHDGQDAGI